MIDFLVNKSNNNLQKKPIKIKTIEYVDGFLYIAFDNNQKILINEDNKKIYDLSSYDSFVKTYKINGRLCAGLVGNYTIYLVDLNTMEILFADKNAGHISVIDNRIIRVIKEIGRGNDALYDIETKRYLPTPNGYKYEHPLGNNLYVFCEDDSKKRHYELKRCIINITGEIILKDIEGWIELNNNHLIIIKKDEISIVEIAQGIISRIKTIRKEGNIIAKPLYYKRNIVILEKGSIKIFNPKFELLKEYKIPELEEIIDLEIVNDILKLCLPHTINNSQVNKQMFINLLTGQIISHLRIDAYPYWTPTTFIGRDSLEEYTVIDRHFYNKDFNHIATIPASYCDSIDSQKQCIFFLKTEKRKEGKNHLVNTEIGLWQEVDYDEVFFHPSLPYGYGVNYLNGIIDFIDTNFNIIISNIDYKKYNLRLGLGEFGYFIVNNYIRISAPFTDGYGITRYRCILLKSNGEVILDSTVHKCFSIGNFIQIKSREETLFLNTLTGEIGPISVEVPTDSDNKIDFNSINDYHCLLSIQNPKSLPSKQKEEDTSLKLTNNNN